MQYDRSQQKKERKKEIQGGILGSEEPRSISNQDNCHVPVASFSVPSLALRPHSDSSSEEITFLPERLIVPQFTKF